MHSVVVLRPPCSAYPCWRNEQPKRIKKGRVDVETETRGSGQIAKRAISFVGRHSKRRRRKDTALHWVPRMGIRTENSSVIQNRYVCMYITHEELRLPHLSVQTSEPRRSYTLTGTAQTVLVWLYFTVRTGSSS